MSGHFHLFVYGTLRRTGANAGMLAGCDWLGPGSVGGVLYNIDDGYPALVLYCDTPVAGEVWRLPASMLLQLDEFEGVDTGLFRRVGVEVNMDNGTTQGCWTYVAGPKLARKLVPGRRIEQWV